MPYRKTPLVKNEIYHVFNRSIARQPIFKTQLDHKRIIDIINFYRHDTKPLRFSHFKRLPVEQKKDILEEYAKNHKYLVEIYAYCIMPNHFHFLLKAVQDSGISIFMRNLQHSYSNYFNIKNNRTGSLFQSMFKAIRIETDEQLFHVSRYIHLNPATSFIISIEALETYQWSSFKDFINKANEGMINKQYIYDNFKSVGEYKKFVYDQAGYQRELDKIKHLIFK